MSTSTTDAVRTGTCSSCGRTELRLKVDGTLFRHSGGGQTVCAGVGSLPVDVDAGEVAPLSPDAHPAKRKGESTSAWRKRLEAAGHTLRGSKADPIHDITGCDLCRSVADAAPVAHPVTGEIIEPSLAQQEIANERPADAWSGATAASLSPLVIDPDPENARGTDYGDLTELAGSLITEGMLQPVIVFPVGDRYQLVMGHRRVAAARLANLVEVPALVRPDLESARRLAAAQATENLQRRNLNPMQEARAFRRLVDAGAKQEEIANRVGVNQGHVSKRLALLKLSDDLQEMVAAGDVSIEDAVEVARLPKAAQAIAATILRSGNPRNAASRAKHQHEEEAARQATFDRLAADGVMLVEWPGWSWSYDDGVPLAVDGHRPSTVYGCAGVLELTPAKHRKCAGHMATVDPHGTVIYLCSDPARHGIPTPDAANAERDAEREAARAARDAEAAERAALGLARRSAALAVAGGKVAPRAMGDFLAAAVVMGMQDMGTSFVPGDDADDLIAALVALEDPAAVAALASGDEIDWDEMPAVEAAAIERVGTLRFAFAASVMACADGLARWGSPGHHAQSARITGTAFFQAFFDLLVAHAGYELTDVDLEWLAPPAPPWTAAPVPEGDIPAGAVAWYGGHPDDEQDEARWVMDAAELDAMIDLLGGADIASERFVLVERDNPENEVREAGARPLDEEVREPVAGDACPQGGLVPADVAQALPAGERARADWSCSCGATVALDAKGVIDAHVIPYPDELPALEEAAV